MANSEWRIGSMGERSVDQLLSRSESLAGCHVSRRAVLPAVSQVSEGGDVWADLPNSPRSGVDSLQHCRGTWAREHPEFRAVFADGSGLIEGGRNADNDRSESWHRQRGECCTVVGGLRISG